MKYARPRRKPAISPKAWLALALFPFIAGFGPPAPGTSVSLSGGGGRLVTKSACSPPEITEFRDVQAQVSHQWEPWGPYGTRLGLGAQADALDSRSKVCDQRGCEESDSSYRDRGTYFAAGAFVTADWEYLGLRLGARMRTGRIRSDTRGAASAWSPIPLDAGARLGPEWLYLSGELGAAAPLLSGGGPFAFGLGGRLYGTDLWGGLSTDLFLARAGRHFGPLRLGLTAGYGWQEKDYTLKDQGNPDGFTTRHYSIPQYRAAVQLGYSFR